MILFNKSQFSVIELSFVFMLFLFVIAFFNNSSISQENDYKFRLDTFVDSIYYSEDYRSIILDEDLSQSSLTENWNSLFSITNKTFSNYEIVISNGSISKNIIVCNGDYKIFSERLISIKNNDKFEFRKIKMGVCY